MCFTPETLIYTKRGLIPIQSIIAGDYVISHNGKYNKVLKIFKRRVEEEIISVVTNYSTQPLRITSSHQIGYMHKDGLDFKQTSNLEVGDSLFVPIPVFVDDIKETDDFLRFYGLFITYSDFRPSTNDYKLCLLNISNSDLLSFVARFVDKHKINDDNFNNVEYIFDQETIDSLFAERLKPNPERMIDFSFYNLNSEKTLILLQGIIEMTCYQEDDYIIYNSLELGTVISIKYLLLRLGIPSSIEHTRNIQSLSKKKSTIQRPKSSSQIMSILSRSLSIFSRSIKTEEEEVIDDKKEVEQIEKDNRLWYKIKFPKNRRVCKILKMDCKYPFKYDNLNVVVEVSRVFYRGDVFDLFVENIHNYLTDCGIVHNRIA